MTGWIYALYLLALLAIGVAAHWWMYRDHDRKIDALYADHKAKLDAIYEKHYPGWASRR